MIFDIWQRAAGRATLRGALLCALLFAAVSVSSTTRSAESGNDKLHATQQEKNGKEMTLPDGVSQETNPHWNNELCNVCHFSDATVDKETLRTNDIMSMCLECHADDVVHKYIHPAEIKVPEDFMARIEKSWKGKIKLDEEKRLTCNTCHDMLNQCLKKRSYMARLNPKFLRNGPYRNRTEICYKCHDISKYERLVAHDQIADDGTLKLNKCRLCHETSTKGRIKSGVKRDLDKFPFINDLGNDRTQLCVRCHKKIDHPTGSFRVRSINNFRHLVPIKDEKKRTLEKVKAETGIYMPLEPVTDRIYCGTCHEAHQPGVFEGEAASSTLVDNRRLRAKKICANCHDK